MSRSAKVAIFWPDPFSILAWNLAALRTQLEGQLFPCQEVARLKHPKPRGPCRSVGLAVFLADQSPISSHLETETGIVPGADLGLRLSCRVPKACGAARRENLSVGFTVHLGARRGLQLGALVAACSLFAAPLWAQAPFKLEDLPSLESELAGELKALDDRQLEQVSWEIFLEENYRKVGIQVRDWDTILGTVRAEVAQRDSLAAHFVDLTWQHATSRLVSGDNAGARQLLTLAEREAKPGNDRLGWIYASMAQADFGEERWTDCRDHLERAALELEHARDRPRCEDWLENMRVGMWLAIGMPELAQETIDRAWNAVSESMDANDRWAAFELRLEFLLVSNDYAGLRALEAEVHSSAWFKSLPEQRRTDARNRFAAGLVEEGVTDPAANQMARERLEDLLAGGSLTQAQGKVATGLLALARIDAGMLPRARLANDQLRQLLVDSGRLDPRQEQNVHARRLLTLDARIALAAGAAKLGDHARLEEYFDHMRAVWESVRSRWSEVPSRDGGVGYLFLGNRQLFVQTLLELGLAVHGDEGGAQFAAEWLIEAQLESTLAKRMHIGSCSLEAVRQSLLSPKRGLLVWVPLRSRSYLVAIDSAQARAFELAGVDKLEGHASDLIGALQAAVVESSPASQAALRVKIQEAQAAFLPEDCARVVSGWDSLYLVGLDDVGFVPFELFPTENGSTQGASRAITRWPSIPVGVELARRAEVGEFLEPSADILIADSVDAALASRAGVSQLIIPKSLREAFEAPLHALAVRTHTGTQANWGVLQGRSDAVPGLLHIVAHGIRRAHERPPGILLAAMPGHDGRVFAEDVEAERSPGIVLLSVCGSARSRLRRGDGGRSDLSAAFLLQGALAVVSSAADLDLVPTLGVGSNVHAALVAGHPLAEAMRQARQSALAKEGLFGPATLAAHLLQVSGAGMHARLRGVSAAEKQQSWTDRFSPLLGRALLALVVVGFAAWLRGVRQRSSKQNA